MDWDAVFIPKCISIQRTVTLRKKISGIQLIPKENGSAKLGTIAQFPARSGFGNLRYGLQPTNREGALGRAVPTSCSNRTLSPLAWRLPKQQIRYRSHSHLRTFAVRIRGSRCAVRLPCPSDQAWPFRTCHRKWSQLVNASLSGKEASQSSPACRASA